MSTTPTITDHAYTIIGQIPRKTSKTLTILLLNHGERFSRSIILNELASIGAYEIITIEEQGSEVDLHNLSHSNVRGILLHRAMTIGEKINIAIREASTTYVLVVWNDIYPRTIHANIAQVLHHHDLLCLVPQMRTADGTTLATYYAPVLYRKRFSVIPITAMVHNISTLFPAKFVGFYHRKRFIGLEGFDPNIANPYWQSIDFGFRALLWGEHIKTMVNSAMIVHDQLRPDDSTLDEGYTRFFLKNMLPRFNGEMGVLSRRELLPFLVRSRGHLAHTIRMFSEIRQWVIKYRFQFKQDALRVMQLWDYEA